MKSQILFWAVIKVIAKDTMRIAIWIIILAVFQGPHERDQPNTPEQQRCRDQQ